MAKIYVASSWRNQYFLDVVKKLREYGHEVLVVPFTYVLSYSFVIVRNLIDEFVVGTVGLVLVGGKR